MQMSRVVSGARPRSIGAQRGSAPVDAAPVGPSTRRRTGQLFAVMLAAFLFAAGPTVVNLIVGGRLPATSTSTGRVAETALGAASTLPFIALFYLVGVVVLVYNLASNRTKLPGFAPILLFLLLFLVITFNDFVNSGGSDIRFAPVLLVAMVPVLWSIRLRYEDLRVIAYVGVLVCLGSLILIPQGSGWMLASDFVLSEKAIVGSRVLGGLFAQSNILGMAVAVMIPFCFLMRRWWSRVLSFALMAYTGLLSASRTSLIAILIATAIMLLSLVFANRSTLKWLYGLAAIGVAATVVIVPLTTTDPAAYTARGRIWQLAIATWDSLSTFVFGTGLSSFGIGSEIALGIGSPSYHGHNQFVSLLTMDGVPCVIAFGVLLFAAVRYVTRTRSVPHIRIAYYYVLMILAVGIAETPLRTDTVDALPWCTWLALIGLICAGATQSREVEPLPTFDEPARTAEDQHSRTRMGVIRR